MNILKKVTLSVLVENTAGGRGLIGEHGLSFLIEADNQRILFDTGQGMALEHNARILKENLNNLGAVVLSHGHYDHTGGLASLLNNKSCPEIYCHPEVMQEKFTDKKSLGAVPVDNRAVSAKLARLFQCGKLLCNTQSVEVCHGIYLTGEIPRTTEYEDTGGDFFNDRFLKKRDSIPDDQALFFVVQNKLIVVLGCAHAGVINTIRYITSLTSRRVDTIIGGMHLINAGKTRLRRTINALHELKVHCIVPLHCTGEPARRALWKAFPNACMDARTGSVFQYP